MRPGGVARRAEQLLQGQGRHEIARCRIQTGSDIKCLNLARRRGAEEHVEQATLNRRADEDLHTWRSERHLSRRLDPDGRIGRCAATGCCIDRQAERPDRHGAPDRVGLVARRDGEFDEGFVGFR